MEHRVRKQLLYPTELQGHGHFAFQTLLPQASLYLFSFNYPYSKTTPKIGMILEPMLLGIELIFHGSISPMNNSLFAELVIETEVLSNQYFGGEQGQSDEN